MVRYLRPQKVPNMSKFWNKDVSERPKFPELRPKFESWTWRAWRQQHSGAWKVGKIRRTVAKSFYDNANAISAAVRSEQGPAVWRVWWLIATVQLILSFSLTVSLTVFVKSPWSRLCCIRLLKLVIITLHYIIHWVSVTEAASGGVTVMTTLHIAQELQAPY